MAWRPWCEYVRDALPSAITERVIGRILGPQPTPTSTIQTVRNECKGKEFSDIIDASNHQYVDLVMEGGGVLGIALTGYTYILEQAGIRFLGVGGTSAGSINALMIAALGPPGQAKSERLLDILSRMPMESFIDGDSDARDFSQAVMESGRHARMLSCPKRIRMETWS
jgi:NTE family protein